MDELKRRREETERRIKLIQGKLNLSNATLKGKACVYATGSFGRREVSTQSDLDLFIGGKTENDGKHDKLLRPLDEICVKAELITAIRNLKLPDFDGGGKYLVHHSDYDLVQTLGRPNDDATNTFTARLLLLLESFPLVEPNVYNEIVQDVISKYWEDFTDHRDEFAPAFLANDILRLWRTFCVNYEANTQSVPEDQKIKRRIKNYKLKHSRLLTCYSALLYLLSIFNRDGTVSPAEAVQMIGKSPTERLEWLTISQSEGVSYLRELLEIYNTFLERTSVTSDELKEKFSEPSNRKLYMEDSHKFGEVMFNALQEIGQNSRFHRLIVV